jgi:hypothetical protein
MKNIVFLIIGSFCSLYAIGQTPASTVVDITIPKGASRLSHEQLTKYISNNFKRSGVPLNKENTYQLNGMIISFWDLSVNPKFKKSLKATQTEMLSTLKLVDNLIIINSQIITVNNVRFLEYEYQIEDEVYLRFQSAYNKNNKNICGIIQFKKPDEAKAHKALDDFLSTVHFKE